MTLGEFIVGTNLCDSEAEVMYWDSKVKRMESIARYDEAENLCDLEEYARCRIAFIGTEVTEWGTSTLDIVLDSEDAEAILEAKNSKAHRIVEMLEDAINDIFATLQNEEGITSGDIYPMDAFELDNATAKVAEIIERVLAYEPRKGDC